MLRPVPSLPNIHHAIHHLQGKVRVRVTVTVTVTVTVRVRSRAGPIGFESAPVALEESTRLVH